MAGHVHGCVPRQHHPEQHWLHGHSIRLALGFVRRQVVQAAAEPERHLVFGERCSSLPRTRLAVERVRM